MAFCDTGCARLDVSMMRNQRKLKVEILDQGFEQDSLFRIWNNNTKVTVKSWSYWSFGLTEDATKGHIRTLSISQYFASMLLMRTHFEAYK